MRPFDRLAALLLVCVGASASGMLAQQPTPPASGQSRLTFRVDSNYIEIDAVVTDAQGKFVRDLTAGDFEVLEDKRPQQVDVFSLVDIPLERADRPAYRPTSVEPDVFTNEKDFDGRLYILVLDANHVVAEDSFLVKRAARLFIQQFMGPNDLASVVHAQTGSMDSGQEFTSSKAALISAIDKFIGEKVPSKAISVASDAIAKDASGLTPRDPNAMERAAKARASLDTLRRVSQHLTGIHGRRKALVLFSEGLDYNLGDPIGPRNNPDPNTPSGPANPVTGNSFSEAVHAAIILDEMQTMFEAATRANVAIYAVDPRGVASEQDTTIKIAGMPQDFAIGVGAVTAGVREELRRQLGTLRTFSEVTGGLAIMGNSDFTPGFRRIVEDNSSYYVLGYRPPEVKADGKFHEITVRVKRPGLQVRARRGYYAAKVTTAPAVPVDPTITLLNSPMSMGGLGLRLTTSTLRGTEKNARVHVTVEIAGKDVGLEDKDGAVGNRINIAYAAVDMNGKVWATGRKTMDLAIKATTRQAVAEHGLRLVTEMELPPGRYQLRLAGHDGLSGKGGSVFWDVDVPDFASSPLVMNHLLLTSSSAGKTPTSFDAPSLKGLLPGPPTAARVFALEDTLAVFAEIYDNNAAHLHTVDLSATVRTDDGTQVFLTKDERSSRDIGAASGGYGYLAKIPLQDLVPGRYVLTVEARSRLGGEPAMRELQFTIK